MAGGEGDVEAGRVAVFTAVRTRFGMRQCGNFHIATPQRAAQVRHAAFDTAGVRREKLADVQYAH
jgi:hypothetical protein